MTTTDGIAVDHRNDGLRQSAYLHLHVEHRETGHTLVVDITATTFHVHVATATERMLHVLQAFALRHLAHGTRQQHHTDALQFTALGKGLTQLQCRLRREGVTVTGTVDGNLRNAVILLEDNLLELPDLFPLSCFHTIHI